MSSQIERVADDSSVMVGGLPGTGKVKEAAAELASSDRLQKKQLAVHFAASVLPGLDLIDASARSLTDRSIQSDEAAYTQLIVDHLKNKVNPATGKFVEEIFETYRNDNYMSESRFLLKSLGLYYADEDSSRLEGLTNLARLSLQNDGNPDYKKALEAIAKTACQLKLDLPFDSNGFFNRNELRIVLRQDAHCLPDA